MTTNGSTQPKRCPCGVAIAPAYDWCESCEHHECPACGNKIYRIEASGAEIQDRGRFCDTCVEDGSDEASIAASNRWAAGLS